MVAPRFFLDSLFSEIPATELNIRAGRMARKCPSLRGVAKGRRGSPKVTWLGQG